jgi:hypothetical protein
MGAPRLNSGLTGIESTSRAGPMTAAGDRHGGSNGVDVRANHKGMLQRDNEADIDFLWAQVLTSRNIGGGWWTNRQLGSNYQVEHYLLPACRAIDVRRACPIVRGHS